jgi:hypothetical protein
MKTSYKISALSFMLLFAVVTAFASNPVTLNKNLPKSVIAHQVNFPNMPDNSFCGDYVVELRNQAGQLVAPAKSLVPGQSRYVFLEKSDLTVNEGTRTASLRNVSGNSPITCNLVFTAQPATIKTVFQPGNVYNYDLYPKPVKIIKD